MGVGNSNLQPALPLHALLQNGLILTPNKRLAAWLHEQLIACRVNRDAGASNQAAQTVLCLPAVIPFSTWLEQLGNFAQLSGLLTETRLLDTNEELILWQQVITADPPEGLLSAAAIARECQTAVNRIAQWQIDLASYRFEISSFVDGAAFLEWHRAMLALLQTRSLSCGWQRQLALLALPAEDRALLCDCVSNANLPRNASTVVALYGFNSLTPLQNKLIAAFSFAPAPAPASTSASDMAADALHFNAAACSYRLERKPEAIAIQPCQIAQREWQLAAQWAAGIKAREPGARVAVVVPSLAEERLALVRIFKQSLQAPFDATGFESASDQSSRSSGGESFAQNTDDAAAAFDRVEVSVGEPLASVPLVRDALLLFESYIHALPWQRWSGLLQSNYLWPVLLDSAARRAVLQAMLASGEKQFRLQELPELLHWFAAQQKSNHRQTVPAAMQAVQRASKALHGSYRELAQSNAMRAHSKQHATLSQWYDTCAKVLSAFGWPGARSLDSIEYQQREALLEWQAQLWRVDSLQGELDAASALRIFRQQLRSKVFHAQTRRVTGWPPVQVLGVLEAEGMLFDYLWLGGLSERQWPLPAATASLLPARLQAEQSMPGANAASELEYARRTTHNLLYSARQVVVSYLAQQDALPAALSPLLREELNRCKTCRATEFPINTTSAVNDWPVCKAAPLEFCQDDYGLALAASTAESHSGKPAVSMQLLGDYALSPLYAYLKHRLCILPVDEPVAGLDARASGTVVHAALEQLFQTLDSQQKIASVNDEQMRQLIATALDKAAVAYSARRYKAIPDPLLQLQLGVLSRRLLAWLAFERQRPAFEVLLTEADIAYDTATLRAQGRIDRVDRLADGSLLVIDYKTGAASMTGWFDQRLAAPQLPGYALALAAQREERIAGIAYGMVFAPEPKLLGIGDEAGGAIEHAAVIESATFRGAGAKSFDALREHWVAAIDVLLQEIAQGYAAHLTAPGKANDYRLQPYAALLREYIDSDSLYAGSAVDSRAEGA
ncbi:MAG: hypothetical protein HKO06_11055 [Pseudomonadales bacterium]|nr:hypothetical protein [Pseudomonadales bacterium]